MSLQKTYAYKMSNPASRYLGLLKNVITPFQYNQTIASVGAQMQFTVQQSADTAALPVDPILDEGGLAITDETGANLLSERQPDLVGDGNSNALIANNNLIQIYEYSSFYPDGLLVYSGYVSKWKTVFGSDNNVLVTCMSLGQDFSNLLVMSGDTKYITQESTVDATFGISNTPLDPYSTGQYIIQTFTVPANTLVGAVGLQLTWPGGGNPPTGGNLVVGVYQMTGGVPNPSTDTLVMQSVLAVPAITSPTTYKVSFSSPQTLLAGNVYYMCSNAQTTEHFWILATDTNPYANGQLYIYSPSLTPGTYTFSWPSYDLYFDIYQHTGNTTAIYTNVDVSFIVTDIINAYIAQGGNVSIPSGGYANTGVLVTYTFKVQTILQAMQTLIGFAPANWYWFIDPATNQLNFAKQNSAADYVLIKGRHINELEIEATKENIKNVAYFTGGDDGTGTSTNIFISQSVTKGNNRSGLAQLSDNRVSEAAAGSLAAAQAIGRALALNVLLQNAIETYISTVTIQDPTIDVNLLKLGKVIGFSGFGNFVDHLLLSSKTVSSIETALAYQQTVDNPAIPS
jgi:hypothetical protein